MTLKEYLELLAKQRELFTPEMISAIECQGRLHDICVQKQKYRDEILDKYNDLIQEGCKKIFAKYPDISGMLPDTEIRMEATKELLSAAHNQTDTYQYITQKMKEFSEFEESSKLLNELSRASFAYFDALVKLHERIDTDRKTLFTEEYVSKMDTLADNGIFLYHLETPDFPLLGGYDDNFIIDSLSFDNCMSAKTLLLALFMMPDVGESMKRKQEDIYISVELMNNNFHRSAARNWFALIESEHKKCANAFEGFWEKKRNLKKGLQRAKKIESLIHDFKLDWELHAWEKINAYYEKITKSDLFDGIVNRNSVIHGDYQSDKLDITMHDNIKLLLLYINLRIIADHICNLEDLYEHFLDMLPTILDMLQAGILTIEEK